MTPDRVRAWGRELRLVHDAFRRQIDDLRDAITAGRPREEFTTELRQFCLGFCSALGRHHVAEDGALFPRVAAEHPDLAPVIDRLREDHVLLGYLLADLEAVPVDAPPDEVLRHLDGIAAIMESHFSYEERSLVPVLDAMTGPDADITGLLGTG